PRIAVRDAVLAPRPVRTVGAPEETEQTLGDRFAGSLYAPIAFERVEVSLDPQQRIGPGARAAERIHRGERGVEKLAGQAVPPRIGRASHHRAEGPQRAAVTVFGPFLFHPMAG